MSHKVDRELKVGSYYYFIRAVNHWLLSKGLENGIFLRDRVEGFEEYNKRLLAEKWGDLVKKAGLPEAEITLFAEKYNEEINAIIIFSEKEISGNTSLELFNLTMITGKLGKTANGLISLKEKNNSQGLYDMGIEPEAGIGGQSLNDAAYIKKIKAAWKVDDLPEGKSGELMTVLEKGKICNLFIFGEDPLGCTTDKKKVEQWFRKTQFLVVQDSFMTSTANAADLILPASFPAETGGTFTNAQKVVQEFDAQMKLLSGMTNIDQFSGILSEFGMNGYVSAKEVFMEFITLFPEKKDHTPLKMLVTTKDDNNRIFDYGCDALVKRFDEEFKSTFKSKI